MAKVIYGVNGGSGHATRSRPIIEELLKKHDVRVFGGDVAYDYLSKSLKVERIYAFDFIYRKNKIRLLETFAKNLLFFPVFGTASLIKLIFFFRRFKPDVVVTDFESFTGWVAKLFGVPIISVDNQHISKNCKIEVSKKFFFESLVFKTVMLLFLVPADYYLITTFFSPKVIKKDTSLFPPIIREEILNLKPKKGRHVIVYQTSGSYTKLIPILRQFKKEEFRIYKADRVGREDNVILRKFEEKEFFKDLASCKAVITNGGFTLITEAIYLGKPILSVPVKNSFEQRINGVHLSIEGFGEHHEEIDKGILENFLKKLPHYSKELAKHHQAGNRKVVNKIEEIIRDIKKRK